MPNWAKVVAEIQALANESNPLDVVRHRYLHKLHKLTKRNIITYYSGWLYKPGPGTGINDLDKNAFMTVVHQLDKSKGLDLILHTPGGDLAATESIVEYLRAMFNTDIRAIVPQLAMSAGTMIACSSREIMMGKHSSLGPIDPQFNGFSAHGVIEEFNRAKEEISANQKAMAVWQVILSKYHPTFIGDCEKAIKWAESLGLEWLQSSMFEGDIDAASKAKVVCGFLANHDTTKNHARHFSHKALKDIGLKIVLLEDQAPVLQDTVLTIHHAFMHSFSTSNAIKIVENHNGIKMIFNRP